MPYFVIQAVRKISFIARAGMTRAILCFVYSKRKITLSCVNKNQHKKKYLCTIIIVFSLLLILIIGIHSISNGLTNLSIDTPQTLAKQNWWYDEITTIDIIIYTVISLFIIYIVWLSNRMINTLIDTQDKRFTEIEHSIRIGELSCGILHDIINPLLSISLCMEELDGNPEKYNCHTTREMIKTAVTASRRMKKFMESAHCTINPHRIHENMTTDLNNEIRMVCDMFTYKSRMLNVRICIDETTPKILVPFHPLRIHQILINLISNALDACAPISNEHQNQLNRKSVHIHVEKNTSHITIHISDNGCGISAKQLKTLFTRPQSTKPRGTGIGLTCVHSIVTKELKGSIGVKSALGIGTTFTIIIPLPT